MKMNGSRKRKRVITACVECYRRKQKCDRKQPCNICSARNVACSYLDSLYGPPGPLNSLDTPVKGQKEEETEQLVEQVSKPGDLSDQIGYSHRTESNALKALEKSLPGQTTAGPRNKSFVVRYLKERFFDTVAALPAPEITDELVEVFFVEANPHVGVLDQYFFRKALASWKSSYAAMDTNLGAVSRDALYFPAVLFQVLAVALQYVLLDSIPMQQLDLSSYVAIDDLSQKYSQLGLELMKLLGRHSPTIMSVQHDLMRAFWLKNCSRGTETWYILGDAIRQAQDLGLHLRSDLPILDDHEISRESLWHDEWKKRLWVSLFNWDAHMALVLGRPRSIHASDCTIDSPLDCNMPASPQDASPAEAMLSETPSLYTRHLLNNFISHKTHEMLSLGANRRYVEDYGIVKRLQDDVLQKLEELSPTSRPSNPDTSWDIVYQYLPKQREHILTFAYSFLVALHRPHTAVHPESCRMATICSLATLESQQRLFDMMPNSHYKSFGTSFYTIDAGLFLSTVLLESSPDPDVLTRSHSALQKAIQRLDLIKTRSPMADSGVKILETCYQNIQGKYPHLSGGPRHDYLAAALQETPSLVSASTPQSQGSIANNVDSRDKSETAPDFADFDWTFPSNCSDPLIDFDLIGNVTDFNASFWTDQMSSILNSNDASFANDHSLWQFLAT